MGRHTGPNPDKIPEIDIKTTVASPGPYGTGRDVSAMRDITVMFDSDGNTTVVGEVQLQGSVGNVEYVDIGPAISVWPSVVQVDQYFTHLRCKTTVDISAGTPKARVGGFYD
jgi:hypothetical protein